MSDWLKTIEDRSYKTYKARLKSAERLQRTSHSWNAALIGTSIATTVASVALLVDPEVYGRRGEVLLVGISILALSASFVVATRNYGARAREMASSYRKIQRLSVEAERLQTLAAVTSEEVEALSERYQDLLDESENHTEADFFAIHSMKWGFTSLLATAAGFAYTALPWLFLIVPAVILIRFAWWGLS